MAKVSRVNDHRTRKCWRCGSQISGRPEDKGKLYARTRRLLIRNAPDKDRTERGWRVANCKYYCQNCYLDGKGKPLI